MKKFSFSASRLLQLREQQVKLAEIHLARASAEVSQAELDVDLQYQALESLADHYMSTTNALTLHGVTSLAMRQRLENARVRLDSLRVSKEAARQHLLKTKRKAESLAALRDRQSRAHEQKQRKLHQRFIDTATIHTWLRERHADG